MASSSTATEGPSDHHPPSTPFNLESQVTPHGDVDHREAAESGPTDNQTSAVRFSSVNQEIEPIWSLRTDPTTQSENVYPQQELSAEAQDALRRLSQSLQRHRSSIFTFEPVSLPTSRVPSNESHSHSQSRTASPPVGPLVQSPPLTPTDTQTRDGASPKPDLSANIKVSIDPATMTPEISPPQGTKGSGLEDPDAITPAPPSSVAGSSREPSTASGQISAASTLGSTGSDHTVPQKRHRGGFSVGPSTSSETTGSQENYTGSSTSFAKPSTPHGDRDDPYARSKRISPPKNKEDIDPRFVFSGRARHQHGRSFPNLSAMGLSRRNSNAADEKPHSEKRNSGVWKRDNQSSSRGQEEDTAVASSSKHGSLVDLKRFFRLGHKSKSSHSASNKANKSGYRTPPSQPSQPTTPFGDENGLTTKYGKLGKVLGSGAGGSVRLMKRSLDGVTFAVKEFRSRHAHETEKEYSKKVTAEFCIGSALHHGNVIEVLDIRYEKGRWYEIMEYAPYDLFTMVTQAKMSREEVTCTFLQIFAGVTYLHSVGLAHRDLKLDNVMVTEEGIMKIIDFGSATVFRYPFENDIVPAQGIVGSDPYLAPEVYDNNKYDPQPVDIWSLAIIYCCMSLRRFPWKVPRLSDNAFKLFASPPDPAADGSPAESSARPLSERPRSTSDLPTDNRPNRHNPEMSTPRPSIESAEVPSAVTHRHHRHHHHRTHDDDSDDDDDEVRGQSVPPSLTHSEETVTTENSKPTSKPSTIKGPWRILRLLPRESRHIIGRMLQISPKHRATLQEMLDDPWIANSPVCRQEEDGRIVSAPGHIHSLIPEANTSAEPARQ